MGTYQQEINRLRKLGDEIAGRGDHALAGQILLQAEVQVQIALAQERKVLKVHVPSDQFSVIQKEIYKSNEDSDGGRCLLRWHEGKIYYLESNYHNGQLFVVVCDDTAKLWELIEVVRNTPYKNDTYMKNGGIELVVKRAMMLCGGVFVGNDPWAKEWQDGEAERSD